MRKIPDLGKRCKENLPVYLILLLISAALVAVDQISKYAVVKYLPKGETVRAIPYLFNFVYVENKGAAWGMLADKRWIFIIVSSVAIVLLAGILLYAARSKKPLVCSLVLIFAGGIGNMIDRIANGYVVDFIQFGFFTSFPVFNAADSFVVIGGFMLVIYVIFVDRSFLSDKKDKTNGKDENGKGDASV